MPAAWFETRSFAPLLTMRLKLLILRSRAGRGVPKDEVPVMQQRTVCIARIGAAHGVRGAVRLWPFTQDPGAVTSFGPLQTQDGTRTFRIARLRAAKNHLVAEIEGITTREAAERLNGIELYAAREKLPATAADEFYHVDLIGLAAVSTAGVNLGDIIAVHNFGAGDIIEIAPAEGGATLMLPFSNAVVPSIDLAGGKALIDLPEEIEGDASPS